MIFGKTKLELKVGIFVFAGIVILAFFVLSIGKFRTWTSGYQVSFIFDFVNGVKVGAPVRFAGMDVGEVKRIDFHFLPQEQKTQVQLHSWVKSGVKIPMDSEIWINTLGLLGEKYVEIIPGGDYGQCLEAGQVMAGVDPVPMHEVFRTAKGIVDNLNQTVTKINSGEGTAGKLLGDDTLYNNLEELSEDLKRHPWKLLWKTKEDKGRQIREDK